MNKPNLKLDQLPKAPPSFRIWGGGTVKPEDIYALLPWIDWAYSESKTDL